MITPVEYHVQSLVMLRQKGLLLGMRASFLCSSPAKLAQPLSLDTSSSSHNRLYLGLERYILTSIHISFRQSAIRYIYRAKKRVLLSSQQVILHYYSTLPLVPTLITLSPLRPIWPIRRPWQLRRQLLSFFSFAHHGELGLSWRC